MINEGHKVYFRKHFGLPQKQLEVNCLDADNGVRGSRIAKDAALVEYQRCNGSFYC